MSWLWTDQLASHFTTLRISHSYSSRFELRFGGVTIKKNCLRESLAMGQLEVRFAGQPGQDSSNNSFFHYTVVSGGLCTKR